MAKSAPAHFPYLDGLRGTAALWVMIGHILIIYEILIRISPGWLRIRVNFLAFCG